MYMNFCGRARCARTCTHMFMAHSAIMYSCTQQCTCTKLCTINDVLMQYSNLNAKMCSTTPKIDSCENQFVLFSCVVYKISNKTGLQHNSYDFPIESLAHQRFVFVIVCKQCDMTHKSAQESQKSVDACLGQSSQCQRVPMIGSTPQRSH